MIMKYFEQDPEDNTFNLLMVDLTHRCNMECANCYLPNREIPDMDVDKLYEFLNKLPKRVIVRLIGAEPTIRNDLPDIIRNVKKCGHQVSVTTNGLRLSSKNYVNKLKEAGLRMVLISMNGAADPDVYAIIDLLVEWDVVSWNVIEEQRNIKREKLKKWSDLI